MTGHATPVLGVDVGFGGDETVVSVRGDVDPLSAPTLGAVLRAQISETRQRPLVLDLARLTFMDAAGLTVIVEAVNRLAEQSENLVVRSLPERTRRIMDITGVTDFVTLDAGASSDDELTSKHAQREMASLHAQRAREDALDATLRVVTGLASGTVDGGSVGALNVYSSSRHFSSHEQGICAVFADAVSGLLAGASPVAGAGDDELAARIRQALTTRDRIARAHGVLISRHGVTALEAAAELHRSARATNRSVDEAASALLASTNPSGTPPPDGVEHV